MKCHLTIWYTVTHYLLFNTQIYFFTKIRYVYLYLTKVGTYLVLLGCFCGSSPV